MKIFRWCTLPLITLYIKAMYTVVYRIPNRTRWRSLMITLLKKNMSTRWRSYTLRSTTQWIKRRSTNCWIICWGWWRHLLLYLTPLTIKLIAIEWYSWGCRILYSRSHKSKDQFITIIMVFVAFDPKIKILCDAFPVSGVHSFWIGPKRPQYE